MLPKIHMSVERWRKNKEYGVWVSNQGRVKLIKTRKYLEPRIDASGYCQVFTDNGAISVHRLVAYTWLGDKRNEKYTIDHINSNKRDNRVKNLRWVSQEVNLAYARFIQSNVVTEETVPQTAVEEDENLLSVVLNMNLKEGTRGHALRTLFKNKKVHIITNQGEILSEEELAKIKRKASTEMDLDKFYGRLTKVLNKEKQYCGLTWSIKENVA